MPRGDRTGPAGMGPRTGRALGFCSGYQTPGYMQPGPGRGLGAGRGFGGGFGRGFGRGGGRGWRHQNYAAGYPGWIPGGPEYMEPTGYPYPAKPMKPEQEIETLKSQADDLQQTLKAVQDRISELETK